MDTEAEELAAMRRTRERLAHPPFRPVGDWAASRALMVAAYDRAIERALSEGDEPYVPACGVSPPSESAEREPVGASLSLSALTEPGRNGRQGEPVRAGAKPLPEARPETPPGSVSARQEATR